MVCLAFIEGLSQVLVVSMDPWLKIWEEIWKNLSGLHEQNKSFELLKQKFTQQPIFSTSRFQ